MTCMGMESRSFRVAARLPVCLLGFLLTLGHLMCAEGLLSYGTANGDTELIADASPLLSLSENYPFYGGTFSNIMVYKDAFITFDATARTVLDLTHDSSVDFFCICAFASQIGVASDSPGAGHVYYRDISDSTQLNDLSTTAKGYNEFSQSFSATRAFVVTWDSVGTNYYDAVDDKTDTFQLVMVTDGTATLVMLEYTNLMWIYDNNPLHYNYYDIADLPVRAQLSFYKDDGSSYKHAYSFSEDMFSLVSNTNVGQSGQWMYRVDTSPVELTVRDGSGTTSSSWTTDSTDPGSTDEPQNGGYTSSEDERDRSIIIGTSVSAGVLVIVVIAAVILLFKLKKRNQENRDRSKTYPFSPSSPEYRNHLPPLSTQYKIPRPATSNSGSIIHVTEHSFR